MSQRVHWGSTQLNTGPVESGLAAFVPPTQSCATCGYFRRRNSSDTSTRPSNAIDLPRSHFAGPNAAPAALGVRASGLKRSGARLWVRMDP